jgi:hypothetical protein
MTDDQLKKILMRSLNEEKSKGEFNTSLDRSKDHTVDPNAMKITLRQYVDNPTGKGSAYVASRGAIKQSLNMAFIYLLQHYRKQFYAIPYFEDNGDLLFYVKVPSTYYDINKISYDVLFELENSIDTRRSQRNIKVYSNCPGFIYTYCYVYNKNGLIIPDLKGKLPIEALTQAPEIRNPIESMGFERSTYMAARYLIDGFCLTDAYVNKFGQRLDLTTKNALYNRIADPMTIVAIYQHAKYMNAHTHKKPISKKEEDKRNNMASSYIQKEKKEKPKTGLFKRAPRAKITARKAKRSLMNDH